jgi:hypothetical protein
VHVELARAVAPVLHDLETTGAPVPRVDDRDWSGPDGDASATLYSADGSGMGIRVSLGDGRADQLAAVSPPPDDPSDDGGGARRRRPVELPDGRHRGRRRRDAGLSYSGSRYFAASRTCAIAARA